MSSRREEKEEREEETTVNLKKGEQDSEQRPERSVGAGETLDEEPLPKQENLTHTRRFVRKQRLVNVSPRLGHRIGARKMIAATRCVAIFAVAETHVCVVSGIH